MRLLALLFLFSGVAGTSACAADSSPELPEWTAQRIFKEKDPKTDEWIKTMTLAEKVGQMIIAAIENYSPASELKEKKSFNRLVTEGKIGGFMFLKGDVASAAALIRHFQSIAPQPLLMSADMERGVAMRLAGGTDFPVNMAVAAAGSTDLAEVMAGSIADEAVTVGLHQNYAPTVDLNNNPQNPVIDTRSFGDRVEAVHVLAEAVIRGMQANGIMATAKHFPGHGDVTVDSHLALPVINADREAMERYELVPFKKAIDAGVISVMVGHLAVPELTGSMEPASLSTSVITGILRHDLGFRGLVITDALNMKALYMNNTPVGEISVRAVEAGNDLLLFSPDPEASHNAIVAAVEQGRIPAGRIDDSVRRILQAKQWLQTVTSSSETIQPCNGKTVTSRSHQYLSKKIVARSLTLLNNRDGFFPLQPSLESGPVVNLILQDRINNETGKKYIAALETHYQVTNIRINPGTTAFGYKKAAEQLRTAKAVLVTSFCQTISSGYFRLRDEQLAFIRSVKNLVPEKTPVVLVAIGTPYISNLFPELSSAICTYSLSDTTEELAVEALRGNIRLQGTLPVSLSGTPR